MRVAITGGGSGLGLGIARALRARGDQVVLMGRRQQVLEEAAHELRCDILPVDLTQADPQQTADRLGRVDHLVLSAGNDVNTPLGQWSRAHFEQTFSVHVVGHALLCQALMAAPRKPRSILAISSTLARRTAPWKAVYSAAKAAQLSLIRSLALEGAEHGMRANALLVGVVPTPMTRGRDLEALGALHPLGLGRPEQVAQAALALLDNAWMTGAEVNVDGGLLL